MRSKLFYPNYEHSILGIPNSLLRYYGAKAHHTSLPILDKLLKRNYKNIILVILDGMGVDILQHNLSSLSFLRRHVKTKISSVFPSTTTAATTTYYSGLAPIEHGWLGWAPYFKDLNRVVELFPNTDYYTGEHLKEKVTDRMPYVHLCDQISNANSSICCSKIFPIFADPKGPANFDQFCKRIKEVSLKKGSQFILAYWAEPDHTSHIKGPYSKTVKDILKNINNQIKHMCANLKNSLVIISADHGHVENTDVFINDYPELMNCLSVPLALDMRVQTIFLKPNKEKTFVQLFNQYLSKDFILIKTEKALEMKLFGPGKAHPVAKGCLGDYLILSKRNKSLQQRLPNDLYGKLLGYHSSLTNKEMVVPLIIIEKK